MAASPAKMLWQPSAAQVEKSQTDQFRQHINRKYDLSLETYHDLWEWSITQRATFWSEVWDWEQIIGDKGSSTVDELATPKDNPRWFEEASLNWAENQLRYATSRPGGVALIQTGEHCPQYSPSSRRMTFKELEGMVSECQRAMRRAGVRRGDRIAWWGGNCLEAVVVLLATSSVGAVFSSAAADFGVDGVLERLEQVIHPIIKTGVERELIWRRSDQSCCSSLMAWSTLVAPDLCFHSSLHYYPPSLLHPREQSSYPTYQPRWRLLLPNCQEG